MNSKRTILFLIILFFPLLSFGQEETYTIKKAPFSSDQYDEFSPVYYKNGIVFCTNRNNSLSNYSSGQDKGLFKIHFIDTTRNERWQNSELLSKNLKTKFNDGPVTFSSTGDTIYFCRNLKIEGNVSELSSTWNKLGIFSAVYDGKKWDRITGMRFNSEWYNISTPWLSSDGKRLYFASDKADGYGGSDIYYSDLKNGVWSDPVNLGPTINTRGNEAYPFINPAGELLFASDGHPGLGGKDIFFSRMEGNTWLKPVRLDPPVNSKYDDFGIITDSLMNTGYFSSNRNSTIDIYRFETNFPQIFYTNIQKENQSCFRFSNPGSILIDTLRLKYIWDFGDGQTASGNEVNHCFPGKGKYEAKLDIFDRRTGKLFFSKLKLAIDLKDFEQPFINAPDVAIKGDTIDFDGMKSLLPGYKIISYSWEFGNGSRMQGEKVRYAFGQSGEYNINLGLKVKSTSTGVVSNTGVTKKIVILSSSGEKESFLKEKSSSKESYPLITDYDKSRVRSIFSAEEVFSKESVFRVVLLTSPTRIPLNSSTFRNLPSTYNVQETFDPKSGLYNYFVDQEMSLRAAYPVYNEMVASGFRNTVASIFPLEDPAEKDLYNINKNYSLLSDINFDSSNRLTTSAYIMLDQIVTLMNKYSGARLEVGVHTDNQGGSSYNLSLSQIQAQIIVNYLINRGISASRLTGKGYGSTRPVISNAYPAERGINRRIDFNLIREQ